MKRKRKANKNAVTAPKKRKDWKVTQVPAIAKAHEAPPRKLRSDSCVFGRFIKDS